MARAATEDPIKDFRFRVVVDGFTRLGFSECSGLDQETEEIKYREGGMNETAQKSAGLTEFPLITLKRGMIIGSTRGGDDDFIDWAQQVFDVASAGNDLNYRRDIDIEQYNAMNVRVRVWTVNNCWPKGFKAVGDLKGMGNGDVVEELRLSNEGHERVL